MMKQIGYLFLLLFPLTALTQNLTGTWEGSGGGVTYIRMVIKHVNDSVYGYTYDEGGGYCKATFAAKYTRNKKNLVGRGIKLLANSGSHVLSDYDLVYSREPGGEFLRDNVGEESFLESIFSRGSRQYLKKTSNKTEIPASPATKKTPPVVSTPPVTTKPTPVPPVVKKAPVKTPPVAVKPKPAVPPVPVEKDQTLKTPEPVTVQALPKPEKRTAPLAVIKRKDERSSKLVQTIYTTADTVKMTVYDNGEVDGDTVTLFFDNAIMLDRYRISDKGKELYFPVSKNGGQHVIELFANNLGSIPPNTALLIITAGKKRYELRASYDLQTNAKIIIQYQE